MTCGPESNLGIDVRVSLSPSACAKAGWPGPVPGQPKPAGWSVHLRNGDRAEDRKLPRAMAEVGSATAEATGVGSAWRGRHPGQRPPTDVEQPCEGCGEVRVQGPSCGLVPRRALVGLWSLGCSVRLRGPQRGDRPWGEGCLRRSQTAKENDRSSAGSLVCSSAEPSAPGPPRPLRVIRPAGGALRYPVTPRPRAWRPAPCTWGRRGSVGDHELEEIGIHKVP
jgi:hypothetical protein